MCYFSKSLCPSKIKNIKEFITESINPKSAAIVVTGISGAVMASLLVDMFPDRVVMVVRKSNDSSHSIRAIEYDYGHLTKVMKDRGLIDESIESWAIMNKDLRFHYTIVDDFKESGATVNRVVKVMGDQFANAKAKQLLTYECFENMKPYKGGVWK